MGYRDQEIVPKLLFGGQESSKNEGSVHNSQIESRKGKIIMKIHGTCRMEDSIAIADEESLDGRSLVMMVCRRVIAKHVKEKVGF